jgi:hypothetical protein
VTEFKEIRIYRSFWWGSIMENVLVENQKEINFERMRLCGPELRIMHMALLVLATLKSWESWALLPHS